ncbi:hypothetical protein [Antarcticirhabdus aurantiaca]|uniref:Uncharacterized protein n=1 Tax=Antarcticirhabdus aurantiaca TaxID=2606717 RepID=A0ACD4NQD9_9HYPH|nr:hypothetical protein [Antarcticirhabdus aurantiaca]WAJ29063.1 hypothetical protein OXU80_02105 [Jeongeuplla avenae]
MTKLAIFAAALGLALSAAAAGPAWAADSIYDYAVSHPVPDAGLGVRPTIGDSVPPNVQLQVPDGGGPFGYFYYEGQPIIVDMATRAVVRIGQ